MSDPGYRLTFSEREARAVFRRVSSARVVLAVLVGVPLEPPWDGATVYLAPKA